MPFCSCMRKPTKNKVTIDEVINYGCDTSYRMLMADVFGSCTDFIEYEGWYFKYRTSTSENYSMNLIIEIKHSLNQLTCNSSDDTPGDDCVVCTDKTKDVIVCCKQPICKKCLKDIQKHHPENFLCPMCRKDLNTYTTKYTLTKAQVKERVKLL